MSFLQTLLHKIISPKPKVLILGSTVIDTLFYVDNYGLPGSSNNISKIKTQVGGTFNVARAIKNCDVKVLGVVGFDYKTIKEKHKLENFKFKPIITNQHSSSANIIIDSKNSTRTSYVKWADEEFKDYEPYLENVDWIHIVYGDTIHDLTYSTIWKLKKYAKYLSIDFCHSDHTLEEIHNITLILELFDFVFMSDNESRSLLKEPYEINRMLFSTAWTIIHSPEKVQVLHSGELVELENKEVLDNKNVLGAGDYFVGYIIDKTLTSNFSYVVETVKDAIKNTVEYIRNND